MNAPLSSETTPELVRELLLDVKDLALKELEVSKLQARDELTQMVRRVFLGLGALGLALIVVAMLAFASALGLSRAFDLPLELSLLVIASVPMLAAVALYTKTRKVKKQP